MSRSVARGSGKASFRTASSVAREASASEERSLAMAAVGGLHASAGGSGSTARTVTGLGGAGSGKARFTITRPGAAAPAEEEAQPMRLGGWDSGAQQASSSSSGRSVTLRREVTPSGSSQRSVVIKTAADDGRQVMRVQKRRSGDMSHSGSGSGSGSGTSGLSSGDGRVGSLPQLRRTITNDAAMRVDEGDEGEQDSYALKRARVVSIIDNSGQAGRGRGPAFAVNFDSLSSTVPQPQAHTAGFGAQAPTTAHRTPALPSKPASGGTGLRLSTADRVAKATAERLAATHIRTNAGTLQPAGVGMPPDASAPVAPFVFPPPVAAAAASTGATAASSSLPSSSSSISSSSTATVLLRNLAPGITGKFLLSHLFPLYDVVSLTVDRDAATGLCRGTAEAVFATLAQAEEAVRLCQGTNMHAQPVRLSIIKDSEAEADMGPMTGVVPAAAPLNGTASAAAAPSSNQRASAGDFFSSPHFSAPPASAAAAAAAAAAPSAFAALAASPASSSPMPLAQPSPLSHTLTNVGFVFDDDEDGAPMRDADEDITFNITNLRNAGMAGQQQQQQQQGAAASSGGPLKLAPAVSSSSSSHGNGSSPGTGSGPSPVAVLSSSKLVQLRPKSVVLSGAAAMAGTSSSKPSFTTSKQQHQQQHHAAATAVGTSPTGVDGWQPKKQVVLAPRR